MSHTVNYTTVLQYETETLITRYAHARSFLPDLSYNAQEITNTPYL